MTTRAPGTTILILGGGIGGVVTATRLRRKLPSRHRVVLIERDASYAFSPSFPWVMAGMRSAAAVTRERAKLARRGVEIIQGEITGLDARRRTVTVNGRTLTGDYLVIALGAELAPEAVPGLVEAGHTFYTLDGAEHLNAARSTFRHGRIAVLVCAVPFKCPAAPLEAALLLADDFRKRGVRDGVEIDIYTPEPGPMPLAGPENSRMLRAMVEARGIGYHPEHVVKQVDPGDKRIHFTNGTTADFDLLVYVPPHRAPQVVREAGLVGESGWLPVDKHTLATRHPGVYAIGDATGIKLPIDKPLPKAGVIAHGEAETVAANLAREITGRGRRRQFDGHGACFIETGGAKAAFGSGAFYTEPAPKMKLRPPGRLMHWGKVAFEKYWLFKWF